jgi:hypothetical protein
MWNEANLDGIAEPQASELFLTFYLGSLLVRAPTPVLQSSRFVGANAEPSYLYFCSSEFSEPKTFDWSVE